ncbi:MAG TPA: hypothetical protein VFY87_28935 [Geminicoccaceae bacterium]|nr:hypothetical protein [Geminicoccaceae bacterium]
MTTIDAILARATERPASTARRAANVLLPYALAGYIAYILLWYLPFKFAPESYLFQVLEDWAGLPWFEPHFRYYTGGVEAMASLLLFVPGLQVAGAAVAFGTMTGAIFFHVFTPLGIDPCNDGGKLFTEACTLWVFSLAILVLRRDEILPLLRRLVTDPRLVRLTADGT